MIERKDILINVGNGTTVHLLFVLDPSTSPAWVCRLPDSAISNIETIFEPHKKRYMNASDMLENVHQEEIEKDRAATIKRLRELGEERARFAADVLQNEWFDFGIEKRPPTLNSVTKDDIVICGTRTYSFYIADKYKINSNRVYCDSTRIRGLSPKRVFIVNRHMFEDELLEAVLSRFTQRSEIIYITEE